MNRAKILGFLAVGGAALMVFAGSASATTLTSSIGGTYWPLTDLHAYEEGSVVIDGTVKVQCTWSTIFGDLADAGSATTTASGDLSWLTFESCGTSTVTVWSKGSLEFHTEGASANGNGTLTSTGAEITVLTHNILGTVHCEYVTNGTDIGRLTGSKNTGGTATLHVDSVPLPRRTTDFGCGSSAEWTGNYIFYAPDYVDVD